MKKIAVLGLTGSIGISTTQIIRQHPEDFKIVLASSNNNYEKLFALAEEFKIPNLVITNKELENRITDFPQNSQIVYGEEKLQELLQTIDCDIVLNAISGSAGLQSSMTTISRGIDLALANKESLVIAGHLIETELKKSNSNLMPVDSEHSAIFQAIGSSPLGEVKKIILTASGGPFRSLSLKKFKKVTLKQTLKHPTWNMGAKITIDSATMMNKGLEVIEAHWLFKKDFSQIKTVIHPQSIIHSFVEFVDGSILAQLSFPNMQLPILYALTYPHHIESDISQTDILDLPDLTFSEVQRERYPLFYLACEVGRIGGLFPTIMNAANEAAIDLFLEKEISFVEIHKLVKYVVETEKNIVNPDLNTIISTNRVINKKIKLNYKNIL